jgi:phage terminase large subunit GpA-like protein
MLAAGRNESRAQMVCCINCPRCDAEHPLLWTDNGTFGMVWDAGRPETVRHVCPHCREAITQADYMKAWGECFWLDLERRFRGSSVRRSRLDGQRTDPHLVAFSGRRLYVDAPSRFS